MARRARPSVIAYAWAAPVSLLGLAAGALTLITGGAVDRRSGVLEFRGAFSRALLESRFVAARAMALGHVILGRDQDSLDACRDHERAHVRQAEILGPLFVPAYLAAGAWAAIRHRDRYRANWFERDAERRARRSAGLDRRQTTAAANAVTELTTAPTSTLRGRNRNRTS